MAKFTGKVGFIEFVESEPGLFRPVVIEKSFSGDLLLDRRGWKASEHTSGDVFVSNRISLLANADLVNNLANIKYVIFMGVKWKVATFEILLPRVILTLGEVYNAE
jgi:hypothetical protein